MSEPDSYQASLSGNESDTGSVLSIIKPQGPGPNTGTGPPDEPICQCTCPCIRKDINVASAGHLSAYSKLTADPDVHNFIRSVSGRTEVEKETGKKTHDFKARQTFIPPGLAPTQPEFQKKKRKMVKRAYLLVTELSKVRKVIALVKDSLLQEMDHLDHCAGFTEEVVKRAERYDKLQACIVAIFESYHWMFRTFYFDTSKSYEMGTFENNLRLSIHAGTPRWANGSYRMGIHKSHDGTSEPFDWANIANLWMKRALDLNEPASEILDTTLAERWDLDFKPVYDLILPFTRILFRFTMTDQAGEDHRQPEFHRKLLSFLHISYGYALFFARHYILSFRETSQPGSESFITASHWAANLLSDIQHFAGQVSLAVPIEGAGRPSSDHSQVTSSETPEPESERRLWTSRTGKDTSGNTYCYADALTGYEKIIGGVKNWNEANLEAREGCGDLQAYAEFMSRERIACTVEDLERAGDGGWAEACRIENSVRSFLFSPPENGEIWEAFETRANRPFFP